MATIKVTFNPQHEYSLFNFMEDEICHLREENKNNTANTYRSVLNRFKEFRKNEDIPISRIDTTIIESYEAWLTKRGLASNTISTYLWTLRKVYNRAMKYGTIKNRRQFCKAYTGVKKTAKSVLPISSLGKIKSLDLSMTIITKNIGHHNERATRTDLPASIIDFAVSSGSESITLDFHLNS